LKIYRESTYQRSGTLVGSYTNPYKYVGDIVFVESHASKENEWVRLEFTVDAARDVVRELQRVIKQVDPPKPRKPKPE